MTPSIDPAVSRPPAFEPMPASSPSVSSFDHYLTDEFTRELTALVLRGRALAEAEDAQQGRHERP